MAPGGALGHRLRDRRHTRIGRRAVGQVEQAHARRPLDPHRLAVLHAGAAGRHRPGGRGARLRAPSGWASTWCCSRSTPPRTPTPTTARFPAPPGTGLLEPLNTLSFLAAHTSTVRLGTAMVLLPQRNPVYTAKEVATLDWLSGGRVDLGIGVGLARGGVPGGERALAAAGSAHRRVPGGPAHAVDRRDLAVRGRVLLAESVPDVPEAGPVAGARSTSAASRTPPSGGWPGPANGWHTFNRAPEDLAEPLGRLDGFLAEHGPDAGRTSPSPSAPTSSRSTPTMAERYAEAGADAVAALVVPMDEDSLRTQLDALIPVQERRGTRRIVLRRWTMRRRGPQRTEVATRARPPDDCGHAATDGCLRRSGPGRRLPPASVGVTTTTERPAPCLLSP